MFIPFLFVKHSKSHSGILVAPHPLFPPFLFDLERQKRKCLCAPEALSRLWYDPVSVNVMGWCPDRCKRAFVKSGECYSTGTLNSSSLLCTALRIIMSEQCLDGTLARLVGEDSGNTQQLSSTRASCLFK